MRDPEDILPFRMRGKPVRREHSFPAAYQLTHVKTGDVYVGSTQDLYVRINKHMTRLEAGEHRSKSLQEAYDLCPEFRVDFCLAVDREDAYDMEQELLDGYRCHDSLLNIAMNARSNGLGVVRSDETRLKLSAATTRQFSTEESRRVHSELTVDLWKDPEYREKQLKSSRISEQASTGGKAFQDRMKNDPEFRKRIVASRSTETTYLGVTYPSLRAASQATGVPPSTIQYRISRSK